MHDHKYFIFQVKAEFEPMEFTLQEDTESAVSRGMNTVVSTFLANQPTLYRRQEYAVLGCNCGDVIRKKVEQE